MNALLDVAKALLYIQKEISLLAKGSVPYSSPTRESVEQIFHDALEKHGISYDHIEAVRVLFYYKKEADDFRRPGLSWAYYVLERDRRLTEGRGPKDDR